MNAITNVDFFAAFVCLILFIIGADAWGKTKSCDSSADELYDDYQDDADDSFELDGSYRTFERLELNEIRKDFSGLNFA